MTNKLRFLQNLLALSAATLIITIWSTVSYLAYQNKLLKNQAKTNSSTASTTKSDTNQEAITNWKMYINEEYGFSIEYHPDSPPREYEGTEDVGQFAYIYGIDFGTNPLKNPHGYTLAITQPKMLENYKTELVGHITDQIDSEENILINGNKWNLLNYRVFVTTDYVPLTLAFTAHKKYDFAITAPTSSIDQILSTFKYLDKTFIPFTCPKNGWVNCQPILSEKEQQYCTQEAFDWYEANCPDYEGAAY